MAEAAEVGELDHLRLVARQLADRAADLVGRLALLRLLLGPLAGDALRREAGKAPKLDFDDEAILEQRPARELTEDEALRREAAAEVRGALKELPSDQSKVIQLAYFGGFSHSEIAEMLGMPLGTIKGRMRLGMEKIRNQLAEGFS